MLALTSLLHLNMMRVFFAKISMASKALADVSEGPQGPRCEFPGCPRGGGCNCCPVACLEGTEGLPRSGGRK